jgi:hypothetical protein
VAPGYAARREDEGGESGSGICVSNRVSWRLRRPWSLVLPQDGQEIRAGWTRRRGRCSGNSERVRDFNCSSQGHRIEYDTLGRCSSMVERPNRSWQMWRSIPSAGPKRVRLEVEAALDDRPHPGKAPTTTIDATAWLTSLACRKAKDLVYPHKCLDEAASGPHAREHGPAEGHACLANLAQGTVCDTSGSEAAYGALPGARCYLI